MGRMKSPFVRLVGERQFGTVRAEVAALRAEVAALSSELDESRRQHQRLAQLTDVVQELLLPAAVRDDAKLAELLEQYTRDLGA